MPGRIKHSVMTSSGIWGKKGIPVFVCSKYSELAITQSQNGTRNYLKLSTAIYCKYGGIKIDQLFYQLFCYECIGLVITWNRKSTNKLSQGVNLLESFLDFPHTDAFWSLCSRWLLKTFVTKGEIAQNEQFLLLPQHYFIVLPKSFQSRLLQICFLWKVSQWKTLFQENSKAEV